jgi:hypothetical protein
MQKQITEVQQASTREELLELYTHLYYLYIRIIGIQKLYYLYIGVQKKTVGE